MKNYSFEFIRHAPSQHNSIKQQWKLKYGDKNFKQSEQFKTVKYSSQLIDCIKIDYDVCKNTREKCINFDKIQLVICSPLRRCLETCRSLIQGSEKQIKVIVEPLLNCRISDAWDIGSSPQLLKKEYPSFDFINFYQWGEHWMFKFFQLSRQMNWEQIQKVNEKWPQHLLQYIRQQGGQTFPQFFKRTRLLKEKLKRIVQTYQLKEQNKNDILVIAHACTLSFLIGTELSNDSKGKVKNKISFKHGQPKRFKMQQVFPQQTLLQNNKNL